MSRITSPNCSARCAHLDPCWGPGITLFEIETRVIHAALVYYRNKTKAARGLGISLRGLRKRVAEDDSLACFRAPSQGARPC